MISKTLMLTSKDRAVPFAYQVPEDVYERFAHYQGIEIQHLTPILNMIDAACILSLQKQIDDWSDETKRELLAKERAENIFA